MTFGHGGHLRRLANRAGRPVEELLDFSASVNPLGPPESFRAVIGRTLDDIVHYPDPDCAELVGALADQYGAAADEILVGNGSTEILYALTRALDRPRAVVPAPCYVDYAAASRLACMDVDTLPLRETDGFLPDWDELAGRLHGDEIVFLGQPNNPTGTIFDPAAFRRFAVDHPDTLFVVDEAFADFVQSLDSLTRPTMANLIVLRSLTKFHAMAGLRLGAAVAGVDLAEAIRRHIPPWSVNTLAQALGVAALRDSAYAEETRRVVTEWRELLLERLSDIEGLCVYPSVANFLLVKLERSELDASQLAQRLLRNDGVAIRVCDNFQGLDDRFFRVAVRTEEENARLVEALGRVLTPSVASKKRGATRRAATLMVQGTTSNAGKTVLVAALCRILLQDGLRVAPFKSQNMSLNSFVTTAGHEMGRAQVVQAQACRLEPEVRMNPILLKPNSDTGCQVIVDGRPVGNMKVAEYIAYKPQAFEAARRDFDALADEFDAVVLEGAGSPAEINLKSHDIVNMQMARYARAPVLLTGDIDRGGLFAAFVGTMELLEPWERRLVQGFIINRFRGDQSLLQPAIDHVQRHTGKPTLGVVPYIHDLGLPEEDSVEFKSGSAQQAPTADDATLDIAVIDLPHISNFTDFDALGIEHDVRLRVVRSADQLGRPDAVILPGSKNVLGDLQYLRQRGFADRVTELAASRATQVVGVCGGFQMLGRAIVDPNCVESRNGAAVGLSLLNVTTALATEKTLARSRAIHIPSGHEVLGYEIHHGKTETQGDAEIFCGADEAVLGVSARDGRVWGTYLHGVFDADSFRRWFLDGLRAARGWQPLGQATASYDIESALDRLADVVRDSLDVDDVYRRMGL